MEFIDTHTHQYSEQFDQDREASVERALNAGVTQMLLPNINEDSLVPMQELADQFPKTCKPMYGLHPCYVKENWKEELKAIRQAYEKDKNRTVAIGEIGIDLYWDKTFATEQEIAFKEQVQWALDENLPFAIHARNSYKEILHCLEDFRGAPLRGVFHCFAGGKKHAKAILELGDFYFGLGGTITFNAEGLKSVLKLIAMDRIILETDSPYLAPEPHRGERNESAYIPYVANKLAELKNLSVEEIANITTANAQQLFGLHS